MKTPNRNKKIKMLMLRTSKNQILLLRLKRNKKFKKPLDFLSLNPRSKPRKNKKRRRKEESTFCSKDSSNSLEPRKLH